MDVVEGEVADFKDVLVWAFLGEGAAHGGVETSEELFHAEGLGDVIVGADFKTAEFVLFEVFGSEEDDGNVFVDLTDFLGDGEAVFLRHHDIEDAGIDVLVVEKGKSLVAVLSPYDGVTFLCEVGFEDGAEVRVVLSD